MQRCVSLAACTGHALSASTRPVHRLRKPPLDAEPHIHCDVACWRRPLSARKQLKLAAAPEPYAINAIVNRACIDAMSAGGALQKILHLMELRLLPQDKACPLGAASRPRRSRFDSR
jgi:hypothetical protein